MSLLKKLEMEKITTKDIKWA